MNYLNIWITQKFLFELIRDNPNKSVRELNKILKMKSHKNLHKKLNSLMDKKLINFEMINGEKCWFSKQNEYQ